MEIPITHARNTPNRSIPALLTLILYINIYVILKINLPLLDTRVPLWLTKISKIFISEKW